MSHSGRRNSAPKDLIDPVKAMPNNLLPCARQEFLEVPDPMLRHPVLLCRVVQPDWRMDILDATKAIQVPDHVCFDVVAGIPAYSVKDI